MPFQRYSYNKAMHTEYDVLFEELTTRADAIITDYAQSVDDLWHRHCELVEMIPIEYRLFLLCSTLDGEIMNGGLIQYFYNHLGMHCDSTLCLLGNIGAEQIYDIYRRAVKVYYSYSILFQSARERDGKAINHDAFISLYESAPLQMLDELTIEYESACREKPLQWYAVNYTLTHKNQYFE